MMSRCYKPWVKYYCNYGGRGICVEDKWHDREVFYKWALVGYRPGLQIDRMDNDGNYGPSNCRWVTPSENTRNGRKVKRSRRMFGDELLAPCEIAERMGVVSKSVSSWLELGTSSQEIFMVWNKMGQPRPFPRRFPMKKAVAFLKYGKLANRIRNPILSMWMRNVLALPANLP